MEFISEDQVKKLLRSNCGIIHHTLDLHNIMRTNFIFDCSISRGCTRHHSSRLPIVSVPTLTMSSKACLTPKHGHRFKLLHELLMCACFVCFRPFVAAALQINSWYRLPPNGINCSAFLTFRVKNYSEHLYMIQWVLCYGSRDIRTVQL